MNEDLRNSLSYIVLLVILFGLLYLMKFVVPHYEPEDGPIDYSNISIQYEVAKPDTTPSTEASESSEEDRTLEATNEEPQANVESYFTELKQYYQTEVLNNLSPGKPRSDIIIRYYKHPPDGNSVYMLSDLGFYIHERPIDKSMSDYESNSIYYGDGVKKEDILIVAYTLIKQGVPIKSIKPSLYHDGWKYNAIEIGADSAVSNQEALTIEQLLGLSLD